MDNITDAHSIAFNLDCSDSSTEMLKITPDGFYVRGVRVPQDDKEAIEVYNSFKEFLTWAQMTRP